MTIHEIDWRYSSIKEILNAVTTALDKIQKEVLPEDVDEALEQLESFLGIAFVAAQTYIAGTTGDCIRIVKDANKIAILTRVTPLPKLKSEDLRNDFGYMISGHGLTKIELCYQIADYFNLGEHPKPAIHEHLKTGQ